MPSQNRGGQVRPRVSRVTKPVQHPGSAAKAALNDCPHERKGKGAHLAAFVSCIPLFDSTLVEPRDSSKDQGERNEAPMPTVSTEAPVIANNKKGAGRDP